MISITFGPVEQESKITIVKDSFRTLRALRDTSHKNMLASRSAFSECENLWKQKSVLEAFVSAPINPFEKFRVSLLKSQRLMEDFNRQYKNEVTDFAFKKVMSSMQADAWDIRAMLSDACEKTFFALMKSKSQVLDRMFAYCQDLHNESDDEFWSAMIANHQDSKALTFFLRKGERLQSKPQTIYFLSTNLGEKTPKVYFSSRNEITPISVPFQTPINKTTNLQAKIAEIRKQEKNDD